MGETMNVNGRHARAICLCAVACVLSGCVTGLQPIASTDTDEPTSIVRIVSVEPGQGPITGGTEVIIRGENFDWPVAVQLGSVPVEVTPIDATSVRIITPPVSVEQAVDVEVQSASGQDVRPSGFAYLGTSVVDDTGSAPVDPDPPRGSTLITGVIEVSHLQMTCPSCLDGRPSDLDVQVNAIFHNPESTSWSAWMPPSGLCAFDVAPPVRSLTTRNVGSMITLTSGTEQINLPYGNIKGFGAGYSSGALNSEAIIRNAAYDLGGSSLPYTGSLLTGRGFDAITPAGLLITFPQSDLFSQAIFMSGQTFTWAPTGPDDFVVDIYVFAPSTGDYVGSVTCRGPDNGSLTVPATYLGSFPAGSSVLVQLSRYRFSELVSPDDGSIIEGISWFGVEGTGYLQP